MNTLVDVGNEDDSLGKALSNFEAYSFMFRGVLCHSMEGLLQSLKFEDSNKQIEICKLVGKAAKFKGKKKKWWLTQTLYWQGVPLSRQGQEYQRLLDEAFESICCNPDFEKALQLTGEAILIHSIGKTDPTQTILTIDEFCSRLEKNRVGSNGL